MTVPHAARNHKPRNGVAWKCGKGRWAFPSRPSPCCSTAHAPVEVEMWRHRFESSRATAIKKKTGGCARSTRATPGVLLRQKPKNALAHFPKMHLALTHVQSTRPLPLASPTPHLPRLGAIVQNPDTLLTDTRPKIGSLCSPNQQPSPPKDQSMTYAYGITAASAH
jgi:hypothetical protein